MRNPVLRQVSAVASREPRLRLLIQHGSRARGDAGALSDWDLAYLADETFDPDGLRPALVTAIGSDQIDLVDLSRASGQLRYRAARDGQVIFERTAGTFDAFWFDAVSFWCDMQGVIRAEYEQALRKLPA